MSHVQLEELVMAVCTNYVQLEVASGDVVLGLLSRLLLSHLQMICVFTTHPSMWEPVHLTSVRSLDVAVMEVGWPALRSPLFL